MSNFFSIGICHSKTSVNIGTLFRSALNYGAASVFTVGRRYERQNSDTVNTRANIPVYNYETIEHLKQSGLPQGCRLVGIDCNVPGREVVSLEKYRHPRHCVYLLGAEDHGLTKAELDACHEIVCIPTCPVVDTSGSLNVATAGTVVMYDRFVKKNLL